MNTHCKHNIILRTNIKIVVCLVRAGLLLYCMMHKKTSRIAQSSKKKKNNL